MKRKSHKLTSLKLKSRKRSSIKRKSRKRSSLKLKSRKRSSIKRKSYNVVESRIKNVAVVVTHHNRLKILIKQYLKNEKIVPDDPRKIKFKNCAIVHVKNSGITIYNPVEVFDKSLIYPNIIEIDKKNCNIDLLPEDNTEIIYVRHGKSLYNEAKRKNEYLIQIKKQFNNKYRDAPLIEEGIIQAKSAGLQVKKIISEITGIKKYIFAASDLYRTQQTISEIINIIEPFSNPIIYVINCIFEFPIYLSPENRSLCNRRSDKLISSGNRDCNFVKSSNGNIYFLKWYKKKYDCSNDKIYTKISSSIPIVINEQINNIIDYQDKNLDISKLFLN